MNGDAGRLPPGAVYNTSAAAGPPAADHHEEMLGAVSQPPPPALSATDYMAPVMVNGVGEAPAAPLADQQQPQPFSTMPHHHVHQEAAATATMVGPPQQPPHQRQSPAPLSPVSSAASSLPLPQLKQLLAQQMDYYFSRQNLANDAYLVSQMDNDQYVPIWTIANFNQIKKLTKDLNLITEVLRESPNVQVDPEGLKVRPNHKRCIVILREIPDNTPIEQVKELFSGEKCPKLVACEFAHNNSWYATFETDEDAQRAFMYLREDVREFQGKPIMARIKAKPLNRLPMPPVVKNGFRTTPPPTAVYDPTSFPPGQQRFIYANGTPGQPVAFTNPVIYPCQQPYYTSVMQPAWPTTTTPGAYCDISGVFQMNGLAMPQSYKPSSTYRSNNARPRKQGRNSGGGGGGGAGHGHNAMNGGMGGASMVLPAMDQAPIVHQQQGSGNGGAAGAAPAATFMGGVGGVSTAGPGIIYAAAPVPAVANAGIGVRQAVANVPSPVSPHNNPLKVNTNAVPVVVNAARPNATFIAHDGSEIHPINSATAASIGVPLVHADGLVETYRFLLPPPPPPPPVPIVNKDVLPPRHRRKKRDDDNTAMIAPTPTSASVTDAGLVHSTSRGPRFDLVDAAFPPLPGFDPRMKTASKPVRVVNVNHNADIIQASAQVHSPNNHHNIQQHQPQHQQQQQQQQQQPQQQQGIWGGENRLSDVVKGTVKAAKSMGVSNGSSKTSSNGGDNDSSRATSPQQQFAVSTTSGVAAVASSTNAAGHSTTGSSVTNATATVIDSAETKVVPPAGTHKTAANHNSANHISLQRTALSPPPSSNALVEAKEKIANSEESTVVVTSNGRRCTNTGMSTTIPCSPERLVPALSAKCTMADKSTKTDDAFLNGDLLDVTCPTTTNAATMTTIVQAETTTTCSTHTTANTTSAKETASVTTHADPTQTKCDQTNNKPPSATTASTLAPNTDVYNSNTVSGNPPRMSYAQVAQHHKDMKTMKERITPQYVSSTNTSPTTTTATMTTTSTSNAVGSQQQLQQGQTAAITGKSTVQSNTNNNGNSLHFNRHHHHERDSARDCKENSHTPGQQRYYHRSNRQSIGGGGGGQVDRPQRRRSDQRFVPARSAK